jgi:hypothetical protein
MGEPPVRRTWRSWHQALPRKATAATGDTHTPGQIPHIERHFTGTATVRDIVIGMVAFVIARAIS